VERRERVHDQRHADTPRGHRLRAPGPVRVPRPDDVDEPVSTIEQLLRRDRAIAITALAGVCLLAWAVIVQLARGMGDGAGMASMTGAMAMPNPGASPGVALVGWGVWLVLART
jgi:hypothetical protein